MKKWVAVALKALKYIFVFAVAIIAIGLFFAMMIRWSEGHTKSQINAELTFIVVFSLVVLGIGFYTGKKSGANNYHEEICKYFYYYYHARKSCPLCDAPIVHPYDETDPQGSIFLKALIESRQWPFRVFNEDFGDAKHQVRAYDLYYKTLGLMMEKENSTDKTAKNESKSA